MPEDPRPSHLDEAGHVRMVEVGEKAVIERRAVARAVVRMSAAARDAVASGTAPKGDVAAVARVAAIQAAKRTADLIPLCHPLALTGVDVEVRLIAAGVEVEADVRCTGRTGVEMEAMTAAAVGALTVYDMVKGMDRGAIVEAVALLEKSGGRSGAWRRPEGEAV